MSEFFYIVFIFQLFIQTLIIFSVIYIFQVLQKSFSGNIIKPHHHQKSLLIGSIFPITELRMNNGKVINLNQTKQKGSILIFTAYGCGSCSKIYPEINEFYKYFNDYQFVPIMVGPIEETNKIIHENKINIPVHQIEFSQLELYKTRTFPYCYILSRFGQVIKSGYINNNIASIESLINQEDTYPQNVNSLNMS